MENLVKVAVFDVDVPEKQNMKNFDNNSKPFTTIIGGKEITWTLSCNFKCKLLYELLELQLIENLIL